MMPESSSTQGECRGSILVVDDDAAVAWALTQALTKAGYNVISAANAVAARKKLAGIDLVLTDVRMPGMSGLDFLAELNRSHPALPVIVATAHGTVDTAVAAVARGAVDYLPKPLDLDRTLAAVARALGNQPLAAQARPSGIDQDLVGTSPAIQEVHRRIAAAVAAPTARVILVGPAGSGKRLVAHLIHRHTPGSGTLTIHDGDLGLPAPGDGTGTLILRHPHLLTVGQQHDLAGQSWRRIISLLPDQPARLPLRQELLSALSGLSITLPPLDERPEDLPPLIRHHLGLLAGRLERPVSLTDGAMAALLDRHWPGNVRELRQVLEEAAILATVGPIAPEHLGLPPDTDDHGAESSSTGLPPLGAATRLATARLVRSHPGEVHQRILDAVEEALIRTALEHTAGNQLKAAELIGLNRVTLKKRMDQLGVGKGD